jgi:hypothetical protein
MVYGSYAPGAPNVFLDDSQFVELWTRPERYYIFSTERTVDQLVALVGKDRLTAVDASGGKFLFTNHPILSAGTL